MANERLKDEIIDLSDSDKLNNRLAEWYAQAKEKNRELTTINVENRLFYEGQDELLLRRKNDPNVSRSSLFVNIVAPAIDQRISSVETKLAGIKEPATFLPQNPDATPEERNECAWIQRQINQQLRDCGYLQSDTTTIFREQVTGAEIYRLSPCQFDWVDCDDEYPVKGGEEIVWEKKYPKGRPIVRWVSPDVFLFQPGISDFKRESLYVGIDEAMSWTELLARSDEYGWDTKKIQKMQTEAEASSKDSSGRESINKDVKSAKGEMDKSVYDVSENCTVVQWWCRVLNGDKVEWRYIVWLNQSAVIHNKPVEFGELPMPFVLASSKRLPGTLESMSSIDSVKYLQRLYNEIVNMTLDSYSYRAFPPFKQPLYQQFKGRPRWEPGVNMYMSHPKEMEPAVNNPGVIPEMMPMLNGIEFAIRNILNSSDLSQGFQANQYEKAHTAQLRFASGQSRSVPTYKDYGNVIKAVAEAFLIMNQRNHPEKERFVVNGGIVVDVPALTGAGDVESERQNDLLLYMQMSQSPLYASPVGQLKLRNLAEEVIRSVHPENPLRFIPNEEEMIAFAQKQLALQIQQLENQSVEKQAGMMAAQAPVPVEQPQQQPTRKSA